MPFDMIPRREMRNENYPCFSCPRISEANCAQCLFARWNVEGLTNAFAPSVNARAKLHSAGSASPLIADVEKRLNADMHPKFGRVVVPSHNRLAELERLVAQNLPKIEVNVKYR